MTQKYKVTDKMMLAANEAWFKAEHTGPLSPMRAALEAALEVMEREEKKPQKQTLLDYAKQQLDFEHPVSEEVRFAVISAWWEQNK